MSQPNSIASLSQVAAKLKSGVEASNAQINADLETLFATSNAKLKSDLEALSPRPRVVPETQSVKRRARPVASRARRPLNLRRLAAFAAGVILVAGIGVVAVLSSRGGHDPNSASVVTPPSQYTSKRVNEIRESFSKH